VSSEIADDTPTDVPLYFPAEWRAVITGVKAGESDLG